MDTKDRRPGAPPDGADTRRGRYHGASDSRVEHLLLAAMKTDPRLAGVEIRQQVSWPFAGPESPPKTPVTIETDFWIPAFSLIVEVDGYTFHYAERVFTSDRRRDRFHAMHGRQVIRFTAKEVSSDPARCASIVAAVCAARRAGFSPARVPA